MFGFLCFFCCCKVGHMVVNVGVFVYLYMWAYEGLVVEHITTLMKHITLNYDSKVPHFNFFSPIANFCLV